MPSELSHYKKLLLAGPPLHPHLEGELFVPEGKGNYATRYVFCMRGRATIWGQEGILPITWETSLRRATTLCEISYIGSRSPRAVRDPPTPSSWPLAMLMV